MTGPAQPTRDIVRRAAFQKGQTSLVACRLPRGNFSFRQPATRQPQPQSSLAIPAAIAAQNRRRASRPATDARAGDGKPVQTDPTVAFEFIATSSFKVLRRPLGSALYVSSKYTERLVQAGVEPSVGSVGDSYDNALAKTINGLYKAEIIHRRGPWRVRFKATTDPNRSYKQDWVHGSSTNRPLPIVRAEHFLAHFKNAPHFIVFKRRAAGRTPSVSALSACKQD